MRVLRLIETSNPAYGGPIEGSLRFGEIWASHGHRQDLLTLDAPEERHIKDYPGEIIPIGPPRDNKLLHRYRYAPTMVAWLQKHAKEYDAILVSGLWRYLARGARVGLAKVNTPYFVLPHGMLDPWFRRTYPLKHLGKQISWWWAEGPLLAGATNVLFTSAEEMHLAERSFWPYNIKGKVIGYGTSDIIGDPSVQSAAFKAVLPALNGRRYLLFLSRIHRKKGCDLLVDAFSRISTKRPDLDLVIAGPDQSGLVEGLRQSAEQFGIASRVHFPGMLKGDVKYGAYRNAEAFVLPSHQENFGIVVAEALAAGTPVLISDKVNIWREIEADCAGLVAADTFEGTVSLLEKFLEIDKTELAKLKIRARKCFLDRFLVDKVALDLIDVISSRLSNVGGR